jgi:fibronectin-binding autotransporter adhesin
MSSRKRSPRIIGSRRQRRSTPPLMENLENRMVLSGSGTTLSQPILNYPTFELRETIEPNGALAPDQTAGPTGLSPQQLQQAYGVNLVMFGAIQGTGAGQTIAVIDAYDNPSFVNSSSPGFVGSALYNFDLQFNLPNPTFTKYNQTGQTSPLPSAAPIGSWGVEEALDIEWAHAIAPNATIDLVEGKSALAPDLDQAALTAATTLGASVVSMSFGAPFEFYDEGAYEMQLDQMYFAAALAQNPDVTFLASTGDNGANPALFPQNAQKAAPLYPSISPLIVAVGGTNLQVGGTTGNYTWAGETGWSYGGDSFAPDAAGGGGISTTYTAPAYQSSSGINLGNGFRTVPDISSDADPDTGVSVYDPYDFGATTPWDVIGGTSLASPTWAGLIAVADQGRKVLYNESPLNGPEQTLPALYELGGPSNSPDNYSKYFHDITVGNNFYSALPGYDLVTGIGSPQANNVLPALAAYGAVVGAEISIQPPQHVIQGGQFGMAVEATAAGGGIALGFNGTATISLTGGPAMGTLGGTTTVEFNDGVAIFNNLTLSTVSATPYTFQIVVQAGTSTLDTLIPNSVKVDTAGTAGVGVYYPLPIDTSLRADVSTIDGDGNPTDDLYLVYSQAYALTLGQLLLENTSSLPSKTVAIISQDQFASTAPVINANFTGRVFDIIGTNGGNTNLAVQFKGLTQGLVIENGLAKDDGGLTIPTGTAVGGGLLVDGGTVTLTNVQLEHNEALGGTGAKGSTGASRTAGPGGPGHKGFSGQGGAIYIAAGSLTLDNDLITGNLAVGGAGGRGGTGGFGGTVIGTFNGFKFFFRGFLPGGPGGTGGVGGTGAGGALYLAGGAVSITGGSINKNSAVGGAGGEGGKGGSAGQPTFQGGTGGLGGVGGSGQGGAIFLDRGSLDLSSASINSNSGGGGRGGAGGTGGPGGRNNQNPLDRGAGGNGGIGGKGGNGFGGGLYVLSGTIAWLNSNVDDNSASAGAGGAVGLIGTGAAGGVVGTAGQAGSGAGGGIFDQGTLTLTGASVKGNKAGSGGGIDIHGNLTLNSSMIDGNTATNAGGGIDITGVIFVNQSELSDNDAALGGAIDSSGTFTITDGQLLDNTATQSGGGIYSSGKGTVSGTDFKGNTASLGGGIYSFTNSILEVNSSASFEENTATMGGAIYSLASLQVDSGSFTSNVATGGSASGGAILNSKGAATITNSQFETNVAANGGAIDSIQGTLSITGGVFAANQATGFGGAIDASGTQTISGVSLVNNSAVGGTGGAIFDQGTLTISNKTLILDNSAGKGGGIANNGMLSIANSSLSSNSAKAVGTSGSGGGIYNSGGSIAISGGTVAGNSATGSGGGIFINQGSLTIAANTDLSFNSAFSGGAIYNAAGVVTLTNVALVGDSAEDDGGAIFNANTLTATIASLMNNTALNGGSIFNTGVATIVDMTISGDSASGEGGGVFNEGTLSLTNSTVAEESAFDGGGVYNFAGTLTTVNVTIAENSVVSGGLGGGLDVAGGTVVLYNTIVAGNTTGIGSAAPASDIVGTVSIASVYNLIGTGGTGGLQNGVNNNIVGVNPKLGPLAANGGPTETIALLTGSPAIDHGGNSISAVTVPTSDERGALRGGVAGEINAGTRVDIGAYEASSSYLVTSSVDSLAYGTLRSAVGWANLSFNDNPLNLANPAPNTVVFDTAHFFSTSQTLALTQGSLEFSDVTTPEAITWNGKSTLTISGGNTTQPVVVEKNVTVDLTGFTISAGLSATGGGAIASDGTLTLTNMTIANNKATGNNGGGVLNESSGTLSVISSTFTDNTSTVAGGAIASVGGLVVSKSTFSGNSAGDGGAIDDSGSMQITGSTFSGNTATSGGAIDNVGSTANAISSSMFTGNSATNGAGIFTTSTGILTLMDTTLSANTASNSGGGVDNEGGTLAIADSTFSGNTAATAGGGIYNDLGSVTATNSTFLSNSASATGFGGGIYSDKTLSLTNVTVANSSSLISALFGGGIDDAATGTLTALNVTVAYNTVATGGGGAGLNVAVGATANLYNTIVALNTLGTGTTTASDIAGTVGGASAFNLIGTGGPGGLTNGVNGNLVGVATPGLASAPAYNGGPTQTIALITNSPAIDAGASSFAGPITAPTVDQRGAVRGPAGINAGLYPDIGAYEASSSYLVSSFADSTDVGTLRTAIGWANVSSNANPFQVINPEPNTIVFSTPGTITLSQGPIALTNTTLGEVIDGANITVSGGGLSGVFTVASGVTASLTDLTITDGAAASNGGGIDNSGTLTLSDVVITGNTASLGGGITNEAAATLSITDSSLTNNTASTSGGGLTNMGAATLLNDTITGNTAGSGGGIANLLSGTLIISGGAVVAAPADLTITDTTLASNSATGGNGGGIDNTGSVTVNDSTINNNSATALGGGIGNESGGIFTATNVTLADNSAVSGGGIGNSGIATFVNATIAYNIVTASGGGVYVAAGTTSLFNTIIASNYKGTVATASDIAVLGSGNGKVGPTSSFNLIGSGGAGGLTGNGNQILAKGVLPGLAAGLANNGGPTATISLATASPAIDAGNASIPGANVPNTDQRGALRGPAGLDAGAKPDIGAFEASSSYLVTTTSVRPDVGTIETAASWANISTNVNPENPIGNPAANTIVFDSSPTGTFATPQTITLTAGPLVFTHATPIAKAIDGAGTNKLVISGGNTVGVLSIAPNVTFDFSGLTISQGKATDGGAIDNFGTLNIQDATLSNNSATNGGAIDNESGATLAISNSTLSNNSATSGGAIYNTGTGVANVTDSTVALNNATSGGGIYNAGTLMIVSATIADNAASTSGGGGGLDATGAGVAKLYDTIVALNTGGGAFTPNDIAGSVSNVSSFNLIDDSASSGGLNFGQNGNIVGVTAGLSTAGLADNGGPTDTIALVTPSPGITGSAALNAGAASITGVTVPQFDQRGVYRTPDHATVIDIGAYEASSSAYLVTTAADSGGGGTLRSAIAWANSTPANFNSGPNTILFDPTTFNAATPQTITLSQALGTLNLTNTGAAILIEGPGAGILTISGNGAIEPFSLAAGVTATFTGLTISKGSASTGGAILNQGTSLTVINDVFSGNAAVYYGGAIYNSGGTLVVSNSTFTNNTAPYGLGGAIDNDGTAIISNSTFTGGSAYEGGAIDNKGGSLSITNSDLESNTGTLGGAIFNNATATITDSTIANDSTSFDGGGIANDLGGTMTIVNSTIAFNHSGQTGGGINQVGGGNNESGSLTVINSTIAYNTINAGGAGGGIDASSGTTTLYNTIVALNTAGITTTATPNDISGTVSLSSAFNLIGTGGAGGLLNGTNSNQVAVTSPGLATALASNGGPTPTIALLAGSPAIDAGSNARAVDAQGNPLLYDQRGPGFPRIVNSVVDIGAYERALATTITVKSSLNPAIVGQSVTFTATVAPAKSNTTTPTGTVTFFVGTVKQTTVTLVNGAATFTTSSLSLGSSTISAVYSGDLTYGNSTSIGLTQTVKAASIAASPAATVLASPFAAAASPVAVSSLTTTATTGSATAVVGSTIKVKGGKKVVALKKALPHGGSTLKFHQTKHTASLTRSVALVAKHATPKVKVKKK